MSKTSLELKKVEIRVDHLIPKELPANYQKRSSAGQAQMAD